MAKGHYRGGSTLLGRGRITKAKGRSGGIGTSGAAVREQRRTAEKKRRQETARKIKLNEKLARLLGNEWSAAKGRKHYQHLLFDERAKMSPLAAALRAALKRNDDAEG